MNTLFEKIWDKHVVDTLADGTIQLYIDRHFCHEVTSPQAFGGLRARGLKVFRPEQTLCMPDHNVPTLKQEFPIEDPISKNQVDTLASNAQEFGITYYGIGNNKNGIIHVVGPENGYTQPGMTIVCGDSHTSTHGAMGAIAFGIGTSEVEMTLATQCIFQRKPKTMRITVDGKRKPGVTAKDIALYIISQMTTGGATGYFVEYAGEAIRATSMEERLTICNLSIEMGARGGMVAPDETTFEYLKGREFAPKGEEWEKALAYWKTLKRMKMLFSTKKLFIMPKISNRWLPMEQIRVWVWASAEQFLPWKAWTRQAVSPTRKHWIIWDSSRVNLFRVNLSITYSWVAVPTDVSKTSVLLPTL